jgi:hypothetical protein
MDGKLEKMLDEWATQKRFVRGFVPLKDGEKPEDFGLSYVFLVLAHGVAVNSWVWVNRLGMPVPDGMREEMDGEFRERLLKEISDT